MSSTKILDATDILSKANDIVNDMISEAAPEVDTLFGEIAAKISDLIRKIKEFTRELFIIERYIVCDRAKDLYHSANDIPEDIKKQIIHHRDEEEVCLFTLEPCVCSKDPNTLVKKLRLFLEEMDKRREASLDKTKSISDSISELKEKFKEFQDAITYIITIAEKVDLIAINAYVEAARLGDSGKGFEIIAENIKKAAVDIQMHGRDINMKFVDLEEEFLKNYEILDKQMVSEKLRKENDDKASNAIKEEIIGLVNNFVTFIDFSSNFAKDIFETVEKMQIELTTKMQYIDIYNQRIGNIGKRFFVISEMINCLIGFYKNQIDEDELYDTMKALEDKFKKIATVQREFEITSEKMDYDISNHTETVGEKLEDAEGDVELF